MTRTRDAALVDDRQLVAAAMVEGRCDLPHAPSAAPPSSGCRRPSARARSGRRALRMDDAASRRHPVELARRITMRLPSEWRCDLAVEQPGDGREPDMRMRPHVDALPDADPAGPIWSKKMKGPTICRSAEGSARRTSKPPRSRARGTMTISIASHAGHRRAADRGREERTWRPPGRSMAWT